MLEYDVGHVSEIFLPKAELKCSGNYTAAKLSAYIEAVGND